MGVSRRRVTLPEDSSTSSSAEKGKLENKKAKDSEALYYIQTAVADHIFPRISVATSAKEAWSILQKEYQGSAKVRIIKLQTLRRDFENMKMKDSETIDEYYTKVRELVNQLKAYGEDLPEKRVVEKLLISVTEKYDPIVTTIEETKDITTLTVTELVGSLEAYEKRHKLEEKTEKGIFLGYSTQSKGYRIYNLKTKKLIISRDVEFDEDAMWNWDEEKVERQSVMIPKRTPPQQQQEEGTDQAEMERRSQQAPGSPRRPPHQKRLRKKPQEGQSFSVIYTKHATSSCWNQRILKLL
ncbi:UNVERIFIED_CONTAM: hypothetical protein Sangu_2560600 [Sesamum angustifolium]|uniref:Uncharacterized protein n=1 Tax=Sesamum angustifolium TaxID=2727405 RepID=A0AAW2J833_9LAMI